MDGLRAFALWAASATLLSSCAQAITEHCTSEPALPGFASPYALTTEQMLPGADADIRKQFARAPYESFPSTRGGLRINYKRFPLREFAPGAQEKGAIVISSGRTEGLVKYPELIRDLMANGYSVYIHDHRGQGYSGRVAKSSDAGDVEHFDDYVADLDRFVNTVVLPVGHKNLFLLAHSMGGGIATLYLESHPGHPFKAAVLSSPMHRPAATVHGMPTYGIACFIAPIFAWFRPEGYVLTTGPYDEKRKCEKAELTHSSLRYQRVVDAYAKPPPGNLPPARVGGPSHRWLAEVCKVTDGLVANASAIKIPVLLLEAQGDTAVDNDAHEEFCEELKKNGRGGCGPRGRVTIPGAWHELFIERDVYRVKALTEILQFFDANAGR
jgi:lysophospholipase